MADDAGLDRAHHTAQKYLTPRYRHLDKLKRYVKGTQYSHLKDWWDDCPLWEKAPCLVYPVADLAIGSNKELLLGDERFPTITSRPEQDEKDEGLDEQSSAELDKLIKKIEKQVRFKARCRQAFESAQGTCDAIAILGARRGKLFIEIQSPKRCTPTFDANGDVARLEIRYPFLRKDSQNQWQCYLYRRVINDQLDILYQEAIGNPDGTEPGWTVKQKVPHGFGFCPVIWHKNSESEDDDVTQFDGHAIHENVLGEIDGLNYTISQRHRAVLYCGDPQVVEIGVEPGYSPTEVATQNMVEATLDGGLATGPDGGNPQIGSYGPKCRRSKLAGGRKKGPGYPWQYADPNVKVFYLTLPPEALKAVFDHCEDLYSKLCDSMAVVIPGPQMGKLLQVITGKGIEALRAKQLDRCDGYRDDFGDGFILRAIDMLLRIAYQLGSQSPNTLPGLVGLDSALQILQKSAIGGDGIWMGPRLTLKWGNYFRPDAEDEQKTVATANDSRSLTTLRSKVQKIAPTFGIEDPDAYLKDLEKENADREAKEALRMHELQKTLVPKEKPGEGRSRNPAVPEGGGENESSPSGPGGGGPAAAKASGKKAREAAD